MARKSSDKPLIKNPTIQRCVCCGEDYSTDEMYNSDNPFYKSTGKAPFCKSCVEQTYQEYVTKYISLGFNNPEKKAMERICMIIGTFYSDEIFDKAMKRNGKANENTSVTSLYFKQANLYQYAKYNYDYTIKKKIDANYDSLLGTDNSMGIFTEEDIDQNQIVSKAKKFFGNISEKDEDYLFLQEQYDDWTTRHECQTKSQEEVFKQICFTQLELQRAMRAKLDTKDLNATLLKQLEAAKLQPKQNKGDTTSETQTFGTLIDKWENTRPIPEIDEDLKDVDKIGLYLDVFFKGHLAKMMGMKNGLSRLYEKYMAKYTVKKPEYNDDEDGEALFDAIFGKSINED